MKENHLVQWKANPYNLNIIKYRIYRKERQKYELLAELDSNVTKYWDRKVDKDRMFKYMLVAVNNENREGSPVIIIPNKGLSVQ